MGNDETWSSETVYVPKKKVTFTKKDGLTPTRNGPARTFNLRTPMALRLGVGEERTIDLGLTCDHPVHIFQARGPLQRGLTLVDGIWAATDAEVPLTLRVRNTSGEPLLVEEGETIARCSIFDDTDWELA